MEFLKKFVYLGTGIVGMYFAGTLFGLLTMLCGM